MFKGNIKQQNIWCQKWDNDNVNNMSPDDLQNLLAAAMKQPMTGTASRAQPVNLQRQPHSVPLFAIFEQSREK